MAPPADVVLPRLSLEPAAESDRAFLWKLHRATMKPHVEKTWGWDEEWQRAYFEAHVDPLERELVMLGDKPVGALEIETREEEIFIASLQIAPAYQGRGIGSQLLRSVQERARAEECAVVLQVLKGNPARRLYTRLGFRETGQTRSHHLMRWEAPESR